MGFRPLDSVRVNARGKTWQAKDAYEKGGRLIVIFDPVNDHTDPKPRDLDKNPPIRHAP